MPGEFTRSSVAALVLVAVLLFAAAFLGGPLPARAAPPVTLPDLVIMVPTDLISIGSDPSSGDRDLRFTHVTADVGAGPFEIDPHYNANTEIATFTQEIYNSPSPGVWSPDHSVPVAADGVWQPPSDYAFPLTKFTLNNVNADGTIGSVVGTSPKTDYCITGDTLAGGVPNAPNQTSPPESNCTDPTKPLGWSVGWADQYDQTDAGQPIDLTGVPDGTYILRGIVDPQHVLTESNPNNDVTDTKLQISGTSVTVLSQTHPVTTPPTGGSGPTGGGGGAGNGKPVLKVHVLRWRLGVLTLVVRGLPKHARLSVELEFTHHRPRFVNAAGGRLRLRTPRPRALVLRVFVGKRRVGKAVTLRLAKLPTVRIVNPIANETLSGTVPIVADAVDDTAISSVRFWVDGRPVGNPLTHAPYVIRWSTRGAPRGEHRISVLATDPAGNTAKGAVAVNVQNPPPPMTCFVLQAHRSARGRGVATARALHTAMSGEILLAFVSANGPRGAQRQAAVVTGSGLSWKLVERSNAATGDSEVWMARARKILTGGQITSRLSDPAYDELLTVIAMEGVTAIGSRARASGGTGVPHVKLATSASTSLVFAVGNDADPAMARTPPSGWVALDQWSGARPQNTFWSEYTNQPTGRPGSTVAVEAAGPVTGRWNLAAAELENSGD
jgi:hypothetical protein